MDQAETQNQALAYLSSLPSDDPQRPKVKRIDTHANIVFLVGSKAYKVKRSVKFPFLDYSTLALREEACKAEITYNQPNAPQIYRQALAITREADGSLTLGGSGEAIEWAIEMNRFEHQHELDIIAEEGPLPDSLSDRLADMMVSAHETAPPRQGSGFYSELASYVEQNDDAFREHPDLFDAESVRHLTETSRTVLTSLHELICSAASRVSSAVATAMRIFAISCWSTARLCSSMRLNFQMRSPPATFFMILRFC